jgi:hypothetical protein
MWDPVRGYSPGHGCHGLGERTPPLAVTCVIV